MNDGSRLTLAHFAVTIIGSSILLGKKLGALFRA